MAAKRRASRYHALKNDLIENLDAETRNAYEAKAAAFNTKLKACPEPSIIYKYACLHIIFPSSIVDATITSLCSLCGWN